MSYHPLQSAAAKINVTAESTEQDIKAVARRITGVRSENGTTREMG